MRTRRPSIVHNDFADLGHLSGNVTDTIRQFGYGIIGGMLRGRLLTESLQIGAELAVPDLVVRRLGRVDVSSSASATQPKTWTFLGFEAPDERADELAAALASTLLADDGWYANFEVGDQDVVIFANTVFQYAKGDTTARQRARAYGLTAGTPEHQLDW